MKKSNFSVAMCTYNGELYLKEQLLSIAKQTRLPDELIIYDDGSTDATSQIINEFRKTAPFPLKFCQNKENLGATKNFEKAIILCNGEIIALSDQDDVWLPSKLEKLEQVFNNYPLVNYVFSDALVVDEGLSYLGYTMWDGISFTVNQRKRFKQGYQAEILLKHNVVTGAIMMFCAKCRDWILPIPNQWIHDAWIALLLSAGGNRSTLVDEPLVKYRQHSTQLIGGEKRNLKERFLKARDARGDAYLKDAESFIQLLERLDMKREIKEGTKKLIKCKIMHLRNRSKVYDTNTTSLKKIETILVELFSRRYYDYSGGVVSAIKDFIMVGQIKR